MNMKTKKPEKNHKELLLKCSCGCNAQLLIQIVNDNLSLIDTRIDGRRRWIGVALKRNDIKRLLGFFKSIDADR